MSGFLGTRTRSREYARIAKAHTGTDRVKKTPRRPKQGKRGLLIACGENLGCLKTVLIKAATSLSSVGELVGDRWFED